MLRFTDDDDLSFCLTISAGIKRDELLAILGSVEELPLPQTFNDFAYETHQPGRKGLLNVFEVGDLLVTVENNGFLGITNRTIKKIARLGGSVHYVTFYHSSADVTGYQYAEVKDGVVLANFDPQTDQIPDFLADFFLQGGNIRREMVMAAQGRLNIEVQAGWLEQETTTYVIDYRTDRD